ncbi:hypothetical protein TGAMA5MH_02236 [Trichoderma gamsii]|uniref:Adenylosuccinate synthetase n=1 Tax=Trichoderma gamsii TaxID=398673 RepID=A0A2K0TL08_9HYPO|nr:hypothetical protein TGAMA5MH_02236 [Trichoderma gamsii]
MPITVILGAQWGDEGKGKLVDGQCQEAQLCARAAVSTTQAESDRPTAAISL